MKIPIIPFYKIERAVRMLPIIKEVFAPALKESESGLLKRLEEKEKYIHDKKADICKLREKIVDLEENLDNCNYELKKARTLIAKEGL